MWRQFYFKVRYDGITTAKIFGKNLLFLLVYQRCHDALWIKLVKTSIKHTLNKVFKSSNFYLMILKTLWNFIICDKIEVWTSLVQNRLSFYAAKLCHICLCVYHVRWIIYGTDFIQRTGFRLSEHNENKLWKDCKRRHVFRKLVETE